MSAPPQSRNRGLRRDSTIVIAGDLLHHRLDLESAEIQQCFGITPTVGRSNSGQLFLGVRIRSAGYVVCNSIRIPPEPSPDLQEGRRRSACGMLPQKSVEQLFPHRRLAGRGR